MSLTAPFYLGGIVKNKEIDSTWRPHGNTYCATAGRALAGGGVRIAIVLWVQDVLQSGGCLRVGFLIVGGCCESDIWDVTGSLRLGTMFQISIRNLSPLPVWTLSMT